MCCVVVVVTLLRHIQATVLQHYSQAFWLAAAGCTVRCFGIIFKAFGSAKERFGDQIRQGTNGTVVNKKLTAANFP